MGAKAEIGWTRCDEAGERWDVYARHVGRDWKFFMRQRRYESWQPVENPPLEDWLELLDALRRLVVRRRYQPEDVEHLEQAIRERFPEAEL
jgi:hypothetical protein